MELPDVISVPATAYLDTVSMWLLWLNQRQLLSEPMVSSEPFPLVSSGVIRGIL